MRFTRRNFLGLAGVTLLAALGAWWSRKPAPHLSPDANLLAWVDTLVPAESNFPGALALGVAERITAAIARDPQYAKLGREALHWIDTRAREHGNASFADLPEARRQNIVAAAAASPGGSIPRTFFQATLDDALFHTYADPRAWVGLGYAGPPQPVGFPDHAAKPKSA